MASLIYLLVFGFSIVLMFSGSFGFGFILMIVSSIVYVIFNNYEEENSRIKQNQQEIERLSAMTAEQREQYNRQREEIRLDNTIDYTIIVGEDSKKSLGSAVVRGAVGGAVLGPVGLVGGAISGKNKTETTFTIVYKSGRREVKTVRNDSYEFQNYARYVR